MHGQSVIALLMEIEGVEQFRIHQKAVDCFHLQIVPNGYFRPETEDQIRKRWAGRLRAPVSLTFEYVAALSMECSGKFRHIVSELAAGQVGRASQSEDRISAGVD
jgi:hypothetical protein